MAAKASKRLSKGGAEQLFPALLFFVFLICTIFTILIGSRVYENIRARDNISFESDTAIAYITNKIHQSDKEGAIDVRQIDNCSVLVLTSHYGDSDYETWIYENDGQLKLMELFARSDSGLGVDDGLDIMECQPLSFSLDVTESGDRILTILLGDDSSARLLIRSAGKGGIS